MTVLRNVLQYQKWWLISCSVFNKEHKNLFRTFVQMKHYSYVLHFVATFVCPIPGRVITTGIWQSLPQVTAERRQQRTAWWHIKLLRISLHQNCPPHTPFALASPSTSPSSTTRSSTRSRRLANSPRQQAWRTRPCLLNIHRVPRNIRRPSIVRRNHNES